MNNFGFIIITIFITQFVFSQEENTFIAQDSISNGMLSLTMDTRIDALLEEKEKRCLVQFGKSTPDNNADETSEGDIVRNPFGRDIDMCKQFPKMSGYKIQLIYTKNSDEANKVRIEFAKYFPGISSESTYLRPDFKVRAGEYLSREAASRDLKNIKKKFPTAIIVRAIVYCKRAQR